MTITERAQKVLTEIDADLALAEKATAGPWIEYRVSSGLEEGGMCFGKDCSAMPPPRQLQMRKVDAAFIAASRTGWPTSLRCLRTAIEGLLKQTTLNDEYGMIEVWQIELLTALCSQWEESRK